MNGRPNVRPRPTAKATAGTAPSSCGGHPSYRGAVRRRSLPAPRLTHSLPRGGMSRSNPEPVESVRRRRNHRVFRIGDAEHRPPRLQPPQGAGGKCHQRKLVDPSGSIGRPSGRPVCSCGSWSVSSGRLRLPDSRRRSLGACGALRWWRRPSASADCRQLLSCGRKRCPRSPGCGPSLRGGPAPRLHPASRRPACPLGPFGHPQRCGHSSGFAASRSPDPAP